MKKLFLLFALMISRITFLQAQALENDILGFWFSQADKAGNVSVIEIFEHGGKYYAYGIVYKNEDKRSEKRDINNPDPSLRSRKMNEVVFLYNVGFNPAKGRWEAGEIYRPEDGKYFYVASGKLSVDGKTLTWRVGIDKKGLMGANLVWTRVPDPSKYATLKTPKDILLKNIPQKSMMRK